MDTISFVQQIKQKQEQFKNNLKGAYPQHRREFSAPEAISNVVQQQIKHVQSASFSSNQIPISQEMSQHQSSPYPQQRNNQTPNQLRKKLENESSASPLIFRTPHVSLHQHQMNTGNLRYNADQSEIRGRDQREEREKTEQLGKVRQLQKSQFKSAEAAPNYNNDQFNLEHQQEVHDYQTVLDEVMKKYRLMQIDLNLKNREIQKTEFYKRELAKEKLRNNQLRDRNHMLKNKILLMMELVTSHNIQEGEYVADLEEQQISFAVQNQSLRSLLFLNSPAEPMAEGPEELMVEPDKLPEDPVNEEVVDKLLNMMIQELNLIKVEAKQKASQNNKYFNTQNLTLTVMNRQNMIDLEEEKLLSQPLQLTVRSLSQEDPS